MKTGKMENYHSFNPPVMGEYERIIVVCLLILISLSYSYCIPSKIQNVKYRFISIIPILYLFTILPLYLSFTLSRFITSFFISWLANFKLILFCFDRGPLSWGQGHPYSLLHFITIAALPCKIKLNRNNPDSRFLIPTKPTKIPLNLASKTVIFAVLIAMLHNYNMHPKLVLVLYLCLLYLNVEVVVDSFSKVVRALLGVELEPPSDEPYLSTSLQDFWGQRWNLMITNILRDSIFGPIRPASVGLLGKDKASLVAVFASFLVSGLMHEFFLYYYLTERVEPTWEMTLFFLIHGVCVVVEMVVKRKLAGGRWRLPPCVSVPLTVGFVVVTCVWLFLPPIIKAGLDVKVIEEFMVFLEYMKNKLQFVYMYITAHRWN